MKDWITCNDGKGPECILEMFITRIRRTDISRVHLKISLDEMQSWHREIAIIIDKILNNQIKRRKGEDQYVKIP